jgi:hypothetical protein
MASLKIDIRDIRSAFAAVGQMLEEAGGVFAFPSPVGKPFIIAGGEEILKDVLIHHASHYGKQHANGILEIFRKTTLPASGVPAWKPVHKIASRISRNSESAELELVALVDKLVQQLADLGEARGPVDVGRVISDWYWQVTLLLVLGKYPEGLDVEYRAAWEACIERLSSPVINALSWYKYLPTVANVWYRFAAWRFRRSMTRLIELDDAAAAAGAAGDVHGAAAKERGAGLGGAADSRWSVLAIMRDDEEFRLLSVQVRWASLVVCASSVWTCSSRSCGHSQARNLAVSTAEAHASARGSAKARMRAAMPDWRGAHCSRAGWRWPWSFSSPAPLR